MTAKELKIVSAYLDAEGWVLFDRDGDPVEEWPSEWPETVNAAFLRQQGIHVA